jgi:hypothetical protein
MACAPSFTLTPMPEFNHECPACGVRLYFTADEYTHPCLAHGEVRCAVYFAHQRSEYVMVAASAEQVSALLGLMLDPYNYRIIRFVGHNGLGIASEGEITWGNLWLEEVEQ